MVKRTSLLLLLSFVATLLLTIGQRLAAGDERVSGLTAVQRSLPGDATVSILDGNRLTLRYRYDDVPFKPCVDELFSPAGVQILRDSPSDHKHHHALMFALKVDGVNFWEEANAAAGAQRHRSLNGSYAANVPGLTREGISQSLDWIEPQSKGPMLSEDRTITVLKASPDFGATLVDWRSHLDLPPGKQSAILGGSHYFGLGMRFVESMDKGGRFFNADDKEGEVVRGTETLTRTKWCAYTAKADGKPVTVAIFDSPKNFRPATMFTMTQPFAYLSATMNVWKEPITLRPGKPLDLCYGIAIWDGEVDKATVEKLYQRWMKLDGERK